MRRKRRREWIEEEEVMKKAAHSDEFWSAIEVTIKQNETMRA